MSAPGARNGALQSLQRGLDGMNRSGRSSWRCGCVPCRNSRHSSSGVAKLLIARSLRVRGPACAGPPHPTSAHSAAERLSRLEQCLQAAQDLAPAAAEPLDLELAAEERGHARRTLEVV